MGTATVTGRDELGRIIDVIVTTEADVAPPGPETVAEGGGAQAVPVYVSDTDPGATGARTLWLQTGGYAPVWWVRSAADDAWETAGAPARSSTADTDTSMTSRGEGGNAYIAFSENSAPNEYDGIDTQTKVNAGDMQVVVNANTLAFHIGSRSDHGIYPGFHFLNVDPSAGAGLPAAVGSFYIRNVADVGTLWFKVGAADTDWEQVTTS